MKKQIRQQEYLHSGCQCAKSAGNTACHIQRPWILCQQKMMGKCVKIVPVANQLYIYFNTKLQCVHEISRSKFNYKKDHYCEALRSTVKGGSDREIEKRAEQNLALLDEIGG